MNNDPNYFQPKNLARCPRCGLTMDEGAVFCPRCQTRMETVTQNSQPDPGPSYGNNYIPPAAPPDQGMNYAPPAQEANYTPVYYPAPVQKRSRLPWIIGIAAGTVFVVLCAVLILPSLLNRGTSEAPQTAESIDIGGGPEASSDSGTHTDPAVIEDQTISIEGQEEESSAQPEESSQEESTEKKEESSREESSEKKEESSKEESSEKKEESSREESSEKKEESSREESSEKKEESSREESSEKKEESSEEESSAKKEESSEKEDSDESNAEEESSEESGKKDPGPRKIVMQEYDVLIDLSREDQRKMYIAIEGELPEHWLVTVTDSSLVDCEIADGFLTITPKGEGEDTITVALQDTDAKKEVAARDLDLTVVKTGRFDNTIYNTNSKSTDGTFMAMDGAMYFVLTRETGGKKTPYADTVWKISEKEGAEAKQVGEIPNKEGYPQQLALLYGYDGKMFCLYDEEDSTAVKSKVDLPDNFYWYTKAGKASTDFATSKAAADNIDVDQGYLFFGSDDLAYFSVKDPSILHEDQLTPILPANEIWNILGVRGGIVYYTKKEKDDSGKYTYQKGIYQCDMMDGHREKLSSVKVEKENETLFTAVTDRYLYYISADEPQKLKSVDLKNGDAGTVLTAKDGFRGEEGYANITDQGIYFPTSEGIAFCKADGSKLKTVVKGEMGGDIQYLALTDDWYYFMTVDSAVYRVSRESKNFDDVELLGSAE